MGYKHHRATWDNSAPECSQVADWNPHSPHPQMAPPKSLAETVPCAWAVRPPGEAVPIPHRPTLPPSHSQATPCTQRGPSTLLGCPESGASFGVLGAGFAGYGCSSVQVGVHLCFYSGPVPYSGRECSGISRISGTNRKSGIQSEDQPLALSFYIWITVYS